MKKKKMLVTIMVMLALGIVGGNNFKPSGIGPDDKVAPESAQSVDGEQTHQVDAAEEDFSDEEVEVLDSGTVVSQAYIPVVGVLRNRQDISEKEVEQKPIADESEKGSKSSSDQESMDDDANEEILDCGVVSKASLRTGVVRERHNISEESVERKYLASESEQKKRRLCKKDEEDLFPIVYPSTEAVSDDKKDRGIKVVAVKDDAKKAAGKKVEDMKDDDMDDGEVLSPAEALEASLIKRGKFDLDYVLKLLKTKYDKDSLYEVLKGEIFIDPESGQYVVKDEYLSGNVRKKLHIAEKAAKSNEAFKLNVEAMKKVLPKDLTEKEVYVKLGAPWVPPNIIKAFIADCFKFDDEFLRLLNVKFDDKKLAWKISYSRFVPFYDIFDYSTEDKTSLDLLEDLLNQKDTIVYDDLSEEDASADEEMVDESSSNEDKPVDGAEPKKGKPAVKKKIPNAEKTSLNQYKQKLIKQKFQEWIWLDPERKARILEIYNERFNCIVPRKYSGAKLKFPGMNPEITLRDYQKDAVAQIVYGGNTLLAHSVGAGKTYEISAAAMTLKQMGLSKKNLIIVPNHLLSQWASDFMKLYPKANLLVATNGDFSNKKMYSFLKRMRDEKHDAIIISLENFSKIPTKLENPFKKSSASSRVDMEEKEDKSHSGMPLIFFEELGIDRLFVDEAHYFKNYHFSSKLLANSAPSSKKAVDFIAKVSWLNRATNERGLILATGTPVSNSIDEFFTLQVYLQPTLLNECGLFPLDNWLLNFGNVETSFEFAPDGVNVRPIKRIASFYNIPDLLNIFFLVANVKNNIATDTNGNIPSVERKVIQLPVSDDQKRILDQLVDRAKAIYERKVPLSEDNMLKVTNDAKKLALEQRFFDPALSVNPNSKCNACARNIARIYHRTKDKKSTQIVFCDMAVFGNKNFDMYSSLRELLINFKVKSLEIAFIHSAKNDAEKEKMFQDVRDGKIRVLIGSTDKMGTGTNVQDRLIALHHLDCPWKPSDLNQREGRIVRFGNTNARVAIFRYITESTFDKYLYQVLEYKQRFISQILNNEALSRNVDFSDDNVLSYEEFKLIAAGDSAIKEKVKIADELKTLESVRQSLEEFLKGEKDERKKTMIGKQIEDVNAQIKAKRENLDEIIKRCEEEKRKAEEEKARRMQELEKRRAEMKQREEEMRRQEEQERRDEMLRNSRQLQEIFTSVPEECVQYPITGDRGFVPNQPQPMGVPFSDQQMPMTGDPTYEPMIMEQPYDAQYTAFNQPFVFGDSNMDIFGVPYYDAPMDYGWGSSNM